MLGFFQTGYAGFVDIIDKVIILQALRNEADLKCMAVPDKYKNMRTFYKVSITILKSIASYRFSYSY